MTDAAPPATANVDEPRGRAALRVAALRGGAASLIVLWIVAVARLLDRPGDLLLFLGFAALAIASLAHADLVAATVEVGGVPALRTLDPELARWWHSLGAEGRDVRYMTGEVVTATDAYETRRRLYVVALSLRLHRLATGSYPPTLNALVPELFAVVPSDVTGAPFVYTPAGTGFTLTPAGAPRALVRVYF